MGVGLVAASHFAVVRFITRNNYDKDIVWFITENDTNIDIARFITGNNADIDIVGFINRYCMVYHEK